MRFINEIIVHCTATPEGRAVTVAEIDSWHKARGWSGIGYHRVVGLKGERWAGRPIEAIGAHCEGHNTGTIGVVYVGGLTADGRNAKDTRTETQKIALREELLDLQRRFPAIVRISGHNQYAAKACPCFDAKAEYQYLLAGLPGGVAPATVDALLKRGDTGQAVVEWRAELTKYRQKIGHPYDAGAGEVFDYTLELVTIWFQKNRGILADGKVGPQTRREMDLALAGQEPFLALA